MQETLAPPAEAGLRERKKAATRAALLDATHRLIDERGYDDVTVEDIAAAAGVSTRTFFNYFESKDDAVLVFPEWNDDEVSQAFAAGGPTGDDAADLDWFVRSHLGHWGKDLRYMSTAVRLAQSHPHLLARHVAIAEAHRGMMTNAFAQRAGRDVPEVADVLGALAVVALVRGAMLAWQQGDGTGLPEDHLDIVRTRLATLLGPPRTTATT